MRETYHFAQVNRKAATGAGKVSDSAGKKGFEKQEIDSCRQNLVPPVPDPNYTVRADEQKSPLNEPVEPVRPADGVRVLQLHLAADHAAGGVGEVEPLREIGGPLEGECVQAMREWRREWWEVAVLRDELVTSEPVWLELERTPEPKRSLALLPPCRCWTTWRPWTKSWRRICSTN